jgi:PPOX class probable F420-dependent enzyme
LQDKKAFGSLATVMPDGSPQVTPVWVDYSDGTVKINTAKGRVKARNMQEGAPVALSIMDPDNPYRHIQIRGPLARTSTRSLNPARYGLWWRSSPRRSR